MEPVMIFLGVVNTSVTLAKAFGVITTEADRLAAQTHGDVRAILEKDFKSALSALRVAEVSTSAVARERASADAAREFRLAESQDRLQRHHRGFAAAVCAALSAREGDAGAARHWTKKAIDHYDAALRGIYRRAEDAARATGRIPGSTTTEPVTEASAETPEVDVTRSAAGAMGGAVTTGVIVSVGAAALPIVAVGAAIAPLAPAIAKKGKGMWALRQAETLGKKVPGAGLIDALNDQALGVQALASELGVSTNGMAVQLVVQRMRRSPMVTEAKLVVATGEV